jgi:hypothetical protein
MRIRLRSRHTGLYYAGTGQWTAQKEQAWETQSFEQARQTCTEKSLANMEALLTSDAIAAEVSVPITLHASPSTEGRTQG